MGEPSGLLEFFDHLRLEDGIDGLDRHGRAALRHRKDVDDAHRKVVNVFANHETHNFHRNTSTTYQEREN